MTEKLLEVKNLSVVFSGTAGDVTAVDDLSFSVAKGSCLCIVGESGSGKSVTAMSLLALIPEARGEVLLSGKDILQATEEEKREIRGKRISIISQDSMNSLNPVRRIGNQIVDIIRIHDKSITRKEARKRAAFLLEKVGIEAAQERMDDYPHQLSGGMKQRVMIAIALAAGCSDLLIADEPTTALDVTVQAGILSLMNSLKKDGRSILLITHDMGVVASVADYVLVMYKGKMMEYGSVSDILSGYLHPYTEGLIQSIPRLSTRSDERLYVIPAGCGAIKGCVFAPCCRYAFDKCHESEPPVFTVAGHSVRCWKHSENRNG